MAKEYIQKVVSLGEVPWSEKIIFWDDFSKGIEAWNPSGNGTDWRAYLTSTTPYIPPCSLSLTTRTTDPAPGDYVMNSKWLNTPSSRRCSCTIVFRFRNLNYVDNMSLQLRQGLMSEQRTFGVKYSYANYIWQYLDSNNSWVDLAGSDMNLKWGWHRLSLKVDFNTPEYLEFVCDNVVIDMSGIAPYVETGTYVNMLDVCTYIVSNGNGPATLDIGYILLLEE